MDFPVSGVHKLKPSAKQQLHRVGAVIISADTVGEIRDTKLPDRLASRGASRSYCLGITEFFLVVGR